MSLTLPNELHIQRTLQLWSTRRTALLKVRWKLRDPHRSACADSMVMEILLPTNPKATE